MTRAQPKRQAPLSFLANDVIAAFQLTDPGADVAAAVAMIRAAAIQAHAAGARIALFPEGFLNGYTRDPGEARARALTVDGDQFGQVVDGLGDLSPVLVVGFIEQDRDSVFSSAAVLDRGGLVGVYRKRHPIEACFDAGTDRLIVDRRGLRFGIGICSDARDSEDGEALARARVDAVLYLLNNTLPRPVAARWRHRHGRILIDRARQSNSWVVSSDVVGDAGVAQSFGCTAAVTPEGSTHDCVPELTTGMVLAPVVGRSGRADENRP